MAMRLRVFYEKGDKQRFLGHLEVMRALIMAVRRAGWPVEMSRGFAPRPRVEMVSPLPVGTAGLNEVADVYLTEVTALRLLETSLRKALPPGFKLQHITEVPREEPALDRRITSSTYRVVVYGARRDLLQRSVERFLSAREARFRRGQGGGSARLTGQGKESESNREIDLKPFVCLLEVVSAEPPELRMILRHFQGKTVRPAWVVAFLADVCGLEGVDPRETVTDRLRLDWGDGTSHDSGNPCQR